MGWLSSLFSSFDSNSSQRSRKGQVFSSTHEAFSLPTSSPVYNSHPDAFNPDVLNTPDPESARSPGSYTYPPPGPAAYGYIPSSAKRYFRSLTYDVALHNLLFALNENDDSSGFIARPASSSLLPTHMDPMHTPLSSPPNYPPLSKTWARIRAWLSREYPELGDTLNYGILPQDLAEIEMQFGFALPAVVRESYLCVDGQEAESAAGCSEGLFFGLTLLPLENVLEEWRFWREVDLDPTTGANEELRQHMQSIPPGWIRREYSQRGWIPLVADKVGNYLGVDLNPGEQGSVGQIIVFGRDFDTKVVMWRGDGLTGWAKWLASFVEELESGEGFEIGAADTSEGSEDEVGYEGYFYDGHGRGQGDGGGDTGSGGGLRLTGEYRGWNVLEAWADRSLRKWVESGVITEEVLAPIDEEARKEERQDLDIVELSMQGPGAVEVAIPVLRSSHEQIPSPTIDALNATNSQPSSSKLSPSPLPIISVTKPPAPRPVALPTPQDIAPAPSPPESRHSSVDNLDEDLESGERMNGLPLPEMAEDVGLVSATRRTGKSKSPIRRETSDASGSALPMSPPPPMLPRSTHNINASLSSPPPIIPDLLADGPLVDEPLTSEEPAVLLEEPLPIQPSTDTRTTNEVAPVPAQIEVEQVEEDAEPETTIRLVGGGGQAGVAQEPPEEEPEVSTVASPAAPESDLDLVSTDAESAPETPTNKKGHKKSKSKSSLASLKRLSQLGHRKKKSSGSTVDGLTREEGDGDVTTPTQ
ncbi:hypothetical protein CVT26_005723 [Gymnopilus dilepis]|uniref:Knr4/Smi1-like domain-containing protein n=1 Tax=Gymnopilus dilepis TaxID=231916 RepID=A0A409YSL3_9AGAR|nr:hypothetical protein CVT26_005723 [Gymnopilus dilepis]